MWVIINWYFVYVHKSTLAVRQRGRCPSNSVILQGCISLVLVLEMSNGFVKKCLFSIHEIFFEKCDFMSDINGRTLGHTMIIHCNIKYL